MCEEEPTYIKVYCKNGHYIVHGEIVIYCFSQSYKKEWELFARDIWVTQDDSEAVKLFDDFIELRDWLGNVYRLDVTVQKDVSCEVFCTDFVQNPELNGAKSG